ncbi:zinc finger protein 131 isoform X2 [Ammospiza nelsoni]|uniref:zinc finger protein 131 isoform X2 n=1 Tax=Melospiza georgiana TaxID=44398 RepID=UPI0025ACFFA2|nr:zinc finger protein 131 isoform X2 [Melospiza georgiana]XP_058679886.1 zinc finger protein 131 isoform X2 [Ammospiza caudacuta]XP_059349118.1 zinc finger protein 131 isoform X2 [Ammospiza nelsoni]
MEAEETMECIQEFPEHYKVILDRLNEQREQDQFTDITLIVDGHHFKAHKAVLAACSQFFHKFFQDFTQEPLVEIEGVSNMAFRHLIEFTYTAKLMVQGEEEANDVWKAAEYLQMLEAIKALEIRNKENSSPLESNEAQGKNKPKKRKIAETSNVITETLPSAESEPVEIEVEIAEGTMKVEDDSIETLEEVASAEQSIKYIQTTGTSDESALALLADITSKYRQGERKCQMQEEGDSATDPSCKQEHMKTHSTENYKCDICNKRYLRESALKQHLTCYHLDEGGASKKQRPGKKIHVCQYCDKQFDHFGHFKEHLRKHTGEKPFECPNCHERFARNSTLKCHLTACQSGAGAKKGRKKLYECQVCNSVFNSWDQFKDHLVIHTGDKPNHCTLCDLWFMQGSELRRHLKEMHNISELLVTEEVLPVEAMEAEPVTSMTIIEQVEQVHVLPVIQVQVDPAQVTVEQMHQDLIHDNQVKGTQMEELQEQVQISYLEVEHIQTEQGAEVHVEQLHVEHVNQIQMEEVQAELIDGTDLEQVEYQSVDQGEAEEKDHNQADDADKEHHEQAEDLKTQQLGDTQNAKVDE